MKTSLIIGLALLFLHSAFPPRLNPDWPDHSVDRAFIFSDYFYYRNYTKIPIDDGSGAYRIEKSPAIFDWPKYVAVCIMIITGSGIASLLSIWCSSKPEGDVIPESTAATTDEPTDRT